MSPAAAKHGAQLAASAALCDLTNAEVGDSVDPVATQSIKCGNCAQSIAATVVQTGGNFNAPANPDIAWLLCPSCEDGSVRIANGTVWPIAPAGGSVANLPEDVAQAWREARNAHGVGAYTASEIVCRKILMHLAVDVAQSDPGATFVGYVDALNTAGYISPGLRSSVDKVKNRGNAADHELPASTQADSLVTLRITEHLLRGIYEIPGL